MKICRG